jgi:Ca-activated chloride channel family protein
MERRGRHHWQAVIAPHLLEHLVRRPRKPRWARPGTFALPALLILILALSGPAWERQNTPFVQDDAPLVVALDLSNSMNAIDVQPTRIERAKQKVRDVLALRPGARTGLIAYSGTAHMVLPQTDDAKIVEMYLMSLETKLMPVSGKEPAAALRLAEEMLSGEAGPGTILFVTDGVAEKYAPVFDEHRKAGRDQVLVLAVGTAKGGPVRSGGEGFVIDPQGLRVTSSLDRQGLEALEARAGVYVVGVTPDNADIEMLVRKVRTHFKSVQAVDDRIPWEDKGYYLLFLLLPLSTLWFRKGWTIRWQ